MNFKQVKQEIGHIITIGALVEKLICCGNCKHFSFEYEKGVAMCCNPAHEIPEEVKINEQCGNWELNERDWLK